MSSKCVESCQLPSLPKQHTRVIFKGTLVQQNEQYIKLSSPADSKNPFNLATYSRTADKSPGGN
jgi:hypothetical protein